MLVGGSVLNRAGMSFCWAFVYFIFLAICLVFFLASCDDGESKSEGSSDDDEMGFKEGSDDPDPKSSITLDGDADPS